LTVVELASIRKSYVNSAKGGEIVAVDGVSLELAAGEMLVLLGPSGCGKSTVLRTIAGLEVPDAGEIRLRGRVANDPGIRIPPEKRRIGMVFQDLALWPHMTVRGNLDFVLTGSKEERGKRVLRAAESAGIAHRLDARPSQLSGGERQRVAIARALVGEPDFLLLDEPLTGLDEALRRKLVDVIAEMRDALDLTAIYVTHHPEEALGLANRVAVMDGGRILQWGTPREVFERPASLAVARHLGAMSVLEGRRVAPDAVETSGGRVPVDTSEPDGDVALVVRPGSVRPASAGNGLVATVIRSSFEGRGWRTRLDFGGHELAMESPSALDPGATVPIRFDPAPAVVRREEAS